MDLTPPPDHSLDAERQAALYALDALDRAERPVFEHHLVTCERCRAIVAEARGAIADGEDVPGIDPSPGFRERLLERATREIEPLERQPDEAPPSPPPARRRERWGWALPLAALAVLVLGVGASLGWSLYANQVVASAVLEDAGGPGTATVVVRRSGAAELILEGLADPPAGHVYQAWIIHQDGVPVPAGVCATGSATLAFDVPVRGATVAITVELSGGASTPSSDPIRSGKIEA